VRLRLRPKVRRGPAAAPSRGLLVISALLAFGVVGIQDACLDAAAATGPPRIDKTSIVTWELPVGQSVRIYARGGYCKGAPPPTIHAVRIREHRLPGRAKFAAIVTVFLNRFLALEAAPRESTRSSEAPAEPVPVCAGVENALYKRIRLHHAVSEVVLFDGSQSPPRRIPEAPSR
jgi:hypothetical protein